VSQLSSVADRVEAVRLAKLEKLRLHGSDELDPADLSVVLRDAGRGRRAGVGGRKLKRRFEVTPEDARAMYERWAAGESLKALGLAYGVDKSTVKKRIDRHMAASGLLDAPGEGEAACR
jgi:hypothetical protein